MYSKRNTHSLILLIAAAIITLVATFAHSKHKVNSENTEVVEQRELDSRVKSRMADFRPLPDPKRVDRSTIAASKTGRPRKRISRKPQNAKLSKDDKKIAKQGTAVAVLRIDPIAFFPPSRILGGAKLRDLFDEVPVIEIEGESYELALLDTVLEGRNKNWRHVSGVVLGYSNSELWYSYNQKSGKALGTLIAGDKLYKLVSRPLKIDELIAIRLNGKGRKDDKKLKRALKNVGQYKSVEAAERLQLKARKLSKIQPKHVIERHNRQHIRIRGGNLGKVDLSIEDRGNAEKELARILADLAPLVDREGSERFAIQRISGDRVHGLTVKYQQVIDGIPVAGSRTIRIEGGTGNIAYVSLGLSFSQKNVADRHEWLSEDAVEKIALSKAESCGVLAKEVIDYENLYRSAIRLNKFSKKLRFERPWDKQSEFELDPIWSLRFYNGKIIRVNARTGASDFISDIRGIGDTEMYVDACGV